GGGVEVAFPPATAGRGALRAGVPPERGGIVRRCLEKAPDRRFPAARELADELQGLVRAVAPPRTAWSPRTRLLLAASAVVLVALIFQVVRSYLAGRHPVAVAPPSPITLLIADFKNPTADPVFEGTLEPVLAIALEGASFVNAYRRHDARKIAAQLKPDASGLDEATARLVAMREGLGAVVSGSIRKSREEYSLSVSAVEPLSGKLIVEQAVAARSKADVLPALGKLATTVRSALGDTAPQSGKSAAIETFTAASIEAAHEYARAQELQHRGESEAAIAHYNKALELDPDLGRAYAGLA